MRSKIEAAGTRQAFVHMEPPERAEEFFKLYNMQTAPRFSDPTQTLYKAFELEQTNGLQFFNPMLWARFIKVGVIGGEGVGLPRTADPFQMPGVFLLHLGKIQRSYRHASVADRPDYVDLSKLDSGGKA